MKTRFLSLPRRLLSLVLVLALLLTVLPLPSLAASNTVNVTIDGYRVQFTSATGYPYTSWNGTTMAPVFITLQTFGAAVTWDSAACEAVATTLDTTVRIPANQSILYCNGIARTLSSSSVVWNGILYAPIRSLIEAFGGIVQWDGTTNTVVINSQMGLSTLYHYEHFGTQLGNYWPTYNQAEASREAGAYPAAYASYLAVLPDFYQAAVTTGNYYNLGLLYRKLAVCLQSTGSMNQAATCYERAAYWYLLASETAADATTAYYDRQEYIDTQRSAQMLRTNLQLYAAVTYNPLTTSRKAVSGLPSNGILLGAYAENDTAVHDSWGTSSKRYWNDFSTLAGKEHGTYLLYLSFGTPLSTYASHIQALKAAGYTLQLSLEPHGGIAQVQTAQGRQYLTSLAQELKTCGIPVLLRFACEMNLESSEWYSDSASYISAFRQVAQIMHSTASNVSMVWSPNFYPPDNYETFYPGDDAVDVVGLSLYKMQNTQVDPLKQGVDRRRWVSLFETFYALYGQKKPVIISEGAVGYDSSSITQLSDATWQLKDFYTYLPILFPNVRAFYYFDSGAGFILSGNTTVLAAYRQAIQGQSYLTNSGQTAALTYQAVQASQLSASACTSLNAFVDCFDDTSVAAVSYYLNGVYLGYSAAAPYAVSCNLSSYVGKTITISVYALDAAGSVIGSRSFTASVVA